MRERERERGTHILCVIFCFALGLPFFLLCDDEDDGAGGGRLPSLPAQRFCPADSPELYQAINTHGPKRYVLNQTTTM